MTATTDPAHRLRSEGGDVSVRFDDTGNVVAVDGDDDSRIPITADGGGLRVEDVESGRKYPVDGEMDEVEGELTQSVDVPDGAIGVNATYRFVDDRVLEIEGSVSDRSETSRVVDVVFSLPLDRSDGEWITNIFESDDFAADSSPAEQADLPIATLRAPDEWSVTYAIPPDEPCRFEMGLAPDSESTDLSLRTKFGLSPDAEGPLRGRASFRFRIDLGADPDWGLRGALRRYYDRHDEWFSTAVDNYGLWQVLPLDRYDDPEHFVFHEAGRFVGDAETVEEYAQNDRWELDDEHGSYTLPYTIPGHREITHLEELPETYEEAMDAFEEWDREPVPFESFRYISSFRDVDELKAIVRNSGLHTADGSLETVIRNTDWGQDSVTFPMNPNPNLERDGDDPTIAKYMLETYVPELLSHSSFDGIYVDSLWGWGNFFNYREEHYGAATISLTYADERLSFGEDGKPGLYNAFSHQEYLRALRELLHEEDKIVMGNGIRTTGDNGLAFNAFALDVLGVELDVRNAANSEYDAAFYRSVADAKPVLSLTHGTPSEEEFATMWKFGLLYGVAPTSDGHEGNAMHEPDPDSSDLPLIDTQDEYRERYAPVLERLMEAGWAPITGVRAGEDDVRVERYGSDGDWYFVVYNTGEATDVAFDVDETVLDSPQHRRVRPHLTERQGSPVDVDAILGDGTLRLDDGELLVVNVL